MLPDSAWGNSNRTSLHGGVIVNITTFFPNPVAGDISVNGDDVLIKTYTNVYYWYAVAKYSRIIIYLGYICGGHFFLIAPFPDNCLLVPFF